MVLCAGCMRWLYADTPTLLKEWTDLGEGLGLDLKGINEVDQQRLISQKLSQYPRWLLIFDNIETYEKIKKLLPERQAATQQILITSRSKNWGQLPVVSVSLFTSEQCHAYFQARLSSKQNQGAARLAARLGYLPLALSHAVAYIQQSDITATDYLERYEKVGVKLLNTAINAESKNSDYDETVLTTWKVSIERLEKRNAIAAEIVKSCAYLHSEGIAEEWIKTLFKLSDLQFDEWASTVVPTICSVVVTYNPMNPLVRDYIIIALVGTTVEVKSFVEYNLKINIYDANE